MQCNLIIDAGIENKYTNEYGKEEIAEIGILV